MESDHKPLEMIHQKSLASAPPRLQRMLLQLQQYDGTIRYRPGKEMLLAAALSRCPSRASGEIKLDMRVDYIAFSKTWIAKLKDTTREDPILGTVYQLTQQGWPHQKRHTPRMARAYWDFRDQLSTDEGLVLMGPRIVILSCLREEYLREETPPGPSLSHQSTAECSSTPILARAGCGHSRLHKEVPGMHTPISASQRVTTILMMCHKSLGREL